MRLTEDNFSTIEEHFFSITLENGFKAILVPKQNFRETVCMLTVGFGSLDNSFTTETGEIFSYPEGVAHFLEHKDTKFLLFLCIFAKIKFKVNNDD